ncbi:MAG: hypothetical protein JO204_03620 [Alphaproteobacteria bacterium]|nr:hypothetical protein [Alphaproteobacteria bacterium]
MRSRREELELVHILAAAIEKHVRGNVEELALGCRYRTAPRRFAIVRQAR